MSKQGFAVIVAGPELAKAMPKTFKQGASYVVASATVLGERTTTKASVTAKATKAKPGPKPKAGLVKTQKATKPTKAAKPTRTTAPKASRKAATGTDVVKFVKQNPGCNMTQIEVGTKMSQADIRKALNSAREGGTIRTEGQRRGLRYFPASGGTSAASTQAPAPAPATAEATSEPPAAAGKAKGSDQPW